MVRHRIELYRILREAPVAGWVSMSEMLFAERMEDETLSLALRRVFSPNLGDCRNSVRLYEKASAALVSRRLAHDVAQNWVERTNTLRHLWLRQLPNRLGLASQISERDDPSGARAFKRSC